MKRCWIGGGLLALLLISGLLTSREMGRFHTELHAQILYAAELAGENREAAQNQVNQVQQTWEKRRKFAAILTDHAPMEQIEEHFTLLTPEAETEDFRETCLRLSAQLQALAQSHLLTLENLF